MISNESGPVNAVSAVLLNEDSTTISPNVGRAYDDADEHTPRCIGVRGSQGAVAAVAASFRPRRRYWPRPSTMVQAILRVKVWIV